MRTTLDLPDPLFRRLKAQAALDGLSLKELVTRYVTAGLRGRAADEAGRVSEPAPEVERFVSAFDLMKDGCGMVKSGHTDLATNPRHMEGFGRD